MKRLLLLPMAMVLLAPAASAAEAEKHSLPLSLGKHGVIVATGSLDMTTHPDSDTLQRRYDSNFSFDYSAVGDGYRITATLLSYARFNEKGERLTGPAAIADEMMKASIYPITYVSDARMVPLRIEDWDTVKARIDKAIPEATKVMAEWGYEATEIQKRYSGLTAESAIPVLLNPLGADVVTQYPPLALNQPASEPMEVNGSHGGRTIKGVMSTTLTQWDTTTGKAHIVVDFTPDPESVKAYVAAFVDDLARRSGTARPAISQDQMDEVKDIEVDHCETDIDIASGLPSRVDCETASGITWRGEGPVDRTHIIMTMTLQP